MPEKTLRKFLEQQLKASPEVTRLVLGFSGGLDSTVLFHALLKVAPLFHLPVVALHVHHGLSPNADVWAEHVRLLCKKNATSFELHQVQVAGGGSLEAAAREARHAAFAKSLQAGDALLLAQHQDDQAETLLFRLLRGAGVTGLGAMHEVSRFSVAGGFSVPQWRPFLALSRAELEHYARINDLQWIEDESNQDTRYARNFLRQEIFPRLQTRWPAVLETLAATAQRLQDADSLLQELAADAAHDCIDTQQRLCIPALQKLSRLRQQLLLRYWIKLHGLPMPGEAMLLRVLDEVVTARVDAMPCLQWPGAELRRYREHLYLLPPLLPIAENWECIWDGASSLALPDGRQWSVEAAIGAGIAGEKLRQQPALTIRYRRGGEHLRPVGQGHQRELKTLLQEAGIPPWERQRLPLLFANDELLAVADLWLAEGWQAMPMQAGLKFFISTHPL